MSLIGFGSNIASQIARRRLDEATSASSRSFERLSSGMRINGASDDAAGLAISSSLSASSRVFSQGIRNLNDGLSLLSIADSTVSDLSSIVIRLKELAEQSANGSFSNQQRSALDKEAQELTKEYFRISRSAQFNKLRLFDGSLAQGLRLQGGYGTDGSIRSSLGGAMGTGSVGGPNSYILSNSSFYEGVTADINGDGNLDMVSAGIDSSGLGVGFVSVRLGLGDGTFGASTSYLNPETGTSSLALGDINGDAKLDLVTSGLDDNTGYGVNTVRLGNGNGTFGTLTSYTDTERFNVRIALADLNGDGKLDMVGTGSEYGSIRLGVGNGSFSSAISFITESSYSGSLVIADLNGDSILDVVTAGRGSDNVGYATINIGRGDGSFSSQVSYRTEDATSLAVRMGDINNDGKLDLVTVGAGTYQITYRLGNGNGTFAGATSISVAPGISLSALSLGDMNGDGSLDIVVGGADGSAGVAGVFLNSGNGTFNPITTFRTDGYASASILLNDFNGDGVLDLFTAGTTSGSSSASNSILFGETRDGINPLLPFSLRTQTDSLQAMSVLERKLNSLSSQRGVIGAFQSRLNTAIANLQSTRENYAAAASRITDIDVANESAALVRTQILQQVATAVLGQANQSPALTLKLLTS